VTDWHCDLMVATLSRIASSVSVTDARSLTAIGWAETTAMRSAWIGAAMICEPIETTYSGCF